MDMAKLTKGDVLHVARLSNLNLTEDELEMFTLQLSKIVDFFSELSEIDTTNIKPTSQTTGLINILRDDMVMSDRMLTQNEALSGTDNTYNGMFRVPKVLKNKI
jgi:aspartyl-tRNA(Asn)/glutamyl-tRNA(Gln) amidotransferase subunit C